MPIVTLKEGHVQPVWSGHPWVFQQAVQSVEGGATAGDEVTVKDPRGNFLGRGLYSPKSAIPVRILTRDPKVRIDGAFFRDAITRALELRKRLGLPSAETNAFRVVHAEGDGLPGLVIDCFGDVVVYQLGTIGMKLREGLILEAIQQVLKPRAILDRTSPATAKVENFEAPGGIVRGDVNIDALRFVERGLRYELPLSFGQKTGFYFDQRPLRARVEKLAKGLRVLDVFSYVGSFAMAAARGGAVDVEAVDQSATALEIGAACARLNGLDSRIRHVRSDAREHLARVGREGGFDLVICDPPKFAPTKGSHKAALGGYQKLAAAACRATKPGGFLVLCSCSGAVGLDELTRALALGARDVRMRATVIERFFQGADHPVPAAFSAGLYLKSVVAVIEAV